MLSREKIKVAKTVLLWGLEILLVKCVWNLWVFCAEKYLKLTWMITFSRHIQSINNRDSLAADNLNA